MFDPYLSRWQLVPDGRPVVTRTSRLLPVRQHGVPAILKIAQEEEEQRGGLVMCWWNGQGAASVLAFEGTALLLERAEGKTSLADLARHGADDEASKIICSVVARLHAARKNPPEGLVPLTEWFADLPVAAAKHGGIFVQSAATAGELLSAPQDEVVLHGDIHHGNILDFGQGRWLAIDPKGLIGERGFDYANIFCNPDHETATAPGRFARQLDVVAKAAGLERGRLLQWILAWAGLSAAWSLADQQPADTALQIAELAAKELYQI